MDNRRIEHYGFVAVSGEESRLTVYSANNAFLTSQIGNSHITAENGLVVIVKADREVREARLLERSPDLSEAERAVRLGDEGFTARDFTNSFVIDTTHLNAEAGQHIFSDLVRELVDR